MIMRLKKAPNNSDNPSAPARGVRLSASEKKLKREPIIGLILKHKHNVNVIRASSFAPLAPAPLNRLTIIVYPLCLAIL